MIPIMAENELARETSPYLLQHSENPVWWHAWNEKTLQWARDEGKPIFLSIGYSSCHWCHVMAHESFENEEIARIMNENFVNIKVDREERPDIDDIYQKACQLTTGQGGWPLSVFLTPDQKPFYVGTYFPPLDSYGRPGFGSLLRRLAQYWRENPADVRRAADEFLKVLQREPEVREQAKLERVILDEAAINLLQLGDVIYGGFGQAPKFPNAACISFLFRYGRLSGIHRFTEFALKTLEKMARGGLYDQIGGGFHRYSTDARWFVPHFEKMLYDNALIPVTYLEAYQITGNEFYLDVAMKTLDYTLREMTSPEGGFYSAQDADSEGEEGKYYTWSKQEIQEVLADDADAFCLYYDVTDGGNWEGKSILCNNLRLSAVAFQSGMTEDQLREKLEDSAARLLQRRATRVAPGRDEKVIVSWNALMITALAKGHRISGDANYLDAAIRCIRFVDSHLLDDGILSHTYKDGKAQVLGYLEDYACYASALLDVFEVCPLREYLERASELGAYLLEHFWDPIHRRFFMTSSSHEDLIVRPASTHDLSIPSGNSVATHLMLRLYHLTQEERFLTASVRVMEGCAVDAAENPFGFGHMLNTIYMHVAGPTEITVLEGHGRGIQELLRTRFLPESIMVMIRDGEELSSLYKYPFFAGKAYKDDTAAFVCKNRTCSLPVYSVDKLEAMLDEIDRTALGTRTSP